jgi:hypothetical protein
MAHGAYAKLEIPNSPPKDVESESEMATLNYFSSLGPEATSQPFVIGGPVRMGPFVIGGPVRMGEGPGCPTKNYLFFSDGSILRVSDEGEGCVLSDNGKKDEQK